MTIETIKFEKNYEALFSSSFNSETHPIQKQDLTSTQTFDISSKNAYYDCCESPDILLYRGVRVCKNCAIVHEPKMEYDYNNLMDSTAHVEKKLNYPYQDHGCRTTFSLENLGPKKRFLYWRLAKLNKYFNNSTEANMKIANQVLFKVASQLEIPNSIYRYALKIYKKAIDMRLTVGRGINNLMVSCLYIACNLNEFSRTIEDFSRVTQISIKNIRKYYRLLLENFNIKLKRYSTKHFIMQYSIELGLSVKFQNVVCQLIEYLKKNGINTVNNPKGLAAAVIYLVSKKFMREKSVKQRNLSNLSQVSEVTIRKYIKLLTDKIDIQNFIL